MGARNGGSGEMAMMRGNTYRLAVKVAACGGAAVDVEGVVRAQFVFESGDVAVEKFYEADGSGDVAWDDDAGVFVVWLSESEVMGFRGAAVKWQVRVVFVDGSVKGTRAKSEYLYDTITERLIGEDAEGEGEQE